MRLKDPVARSPPLRMVTPAEPLDPIVTSPKDTLGGSELRAAGDRPLPSSPTDAEPPGEAVKRRVAWLTETVSVEKSTVTEQLSPAARTFPSQSAALRLKNDTSLPSRVTARGPAG